MRASQFLHDKGRPASYHPKFRMLVGSVTSAIFLENFMYWDDKTHDPDGWCYKTSDEIEKETGLSYEEQKTARKRLKQLGLIHEKHDRLNHRMFFQVNFEKLDNLWVQVFSRTRESLVRERGNPLFGNEGIPRSIYNTSHTTSSTSSPTRTEAKTDELSSMKQTVIEKYNEVATKRDWFLVDTSKKQLPKKTNDLLVKFVEDLECVGSLDEYCEKVSELDWAEAMRIDFFLRKNTFKKTMSGEWGPRAPSPQSKFKKTEEQDVEEMSGPMRKAYEDFVSSKKAP